MTLQERRQKLKKYLQSKRTQPQITLKRKSGALPKRAIDFFIQKYQIDTYDALNEVLETLQDKQQLISDMWEYDLVK